MPARPRLQAEVKPLTQDELERLWAEAGQALGIADLLAAARVRLADQPGHFEAEATTVYFADEFKLHKLHVLEYLREHTGMRMLDCKVIPMYVSKEALPYRAEEKYEAMAKHNPKMAELLKIFPEIEI